MKELIERLEFFEVSLHSIKYDRINSTIRLSLFHKDLMEASEINIYGVQDFNFDQENFVDTIIYELIKKGFMN